MNVKKKKKKKKKKNFYINFYIYTLFLGHFCEAY